jgi:hypothetical protein
VIVRRTRTHLAQLLSLIIAAGFGAALLNAVLIAPAAAQIAGLPSVPGIQPLVLTPLTPAELNGEPGPVGVLQRTHPDYAPVPFTVRGFDVYPAFDELGTFDTNIFATKNAAASDFIVRTRPNLHVENGRRGTSAVTTALDIFAEDDRFVGHSNLSNDNAGAALLLNDDFSEGFKALSRTTFVYQHQDPATLTTNTPGLRLRQLPAVKTFTQEFGIDKELAPYGLILDGSYTRQDYQNAPLIDGATLNQTGLDGNIVRIAPKFAYDVAPDLRPFVQGSYARYAYDNGVLSANEFAGIFGADFDIRRLLRGTLFAGYKEHLYDESSIPTARGPTYGLNLTWFATERLTLSAAGSQTYYDATTTTTNGVHSTINTNTIAFEADFEALENLILVGIASYENDDYHQLGRGDNVYSAGIGAQYLVSQSLTLLAQYQFSDRISNNSAFNYARNTISLGVKIAF